MLAFSIEDLRRTEWKLVREVEQRKAAEQEAREINRRLEQSNRILDQAIANRTDELRKTVTRNEILFKELKHRVKNNLQIISGLIGLQSRNLSDQTTRDQFVRLQSQIGAIAATYELLHRTHGEETVDFGKLLPALCHKS
jgi:two-component sensor histidine kinase